MFTGIVTDVGRVRSIQHDGDTRFEITTAYDMGAVEIGASIANSGVCLTVTSKSDDMFSVDISDETVSRTGVLRRALCQPALPTTKQHIRRHVAPHSAH